MPSQTQHLPEVSESFKRLNPSKARGHKGILTKPRPSPGCRRRNGFTLVEMVVSFLIISIILAIGFATYRLVKSKGRAGAMVGMIESFEKSLWMYCQANGHYPPETPRGQDPGFLSNVHLEPSWGGPFANRTSFDFSLTPMGGQWDWNNNEGATPSPTSPGTYLISVVEGDNPIDNLAGQYVDELVDDGDLNTGRWVRSRWSSAYCYVIETRDDCLPQTTE